MYKRYEQLLKERGLRTSDVCRGTGIDAATMSNWKKGNYTPKSDKLQKIADFFEVPLLYFYDNGTTDVDSWVNNMEDNDDYIDELTSLENVLKMDKDLAKTDFTAEQLDKIIEYAKWITRDVK